MHPNDEFHPPTNDDPYWSETNWFAFGVPDRKLSGWLYPFFRPALGVCSAAVLLWDDQGDQVWNCRYYKQFWHLPMPDGPLSDFTLANGLSYRCTEEEMVNGRGHWAVRTATRSAGRRRQPGRQRFMC